MSIKSRMTALISEAETATFDGKTLPIVDLNKQIKGTTQVVNALQQLGPTQAAAEAYLGVLQMHAKDKTRAGAGYYGVQHLKDELAFMTDLVALLKKHRGNVMLRGGAGAARSTQDWADDVFMSMR